MNVTIAIAGLLAFPAPEARDAAAAPGAGASPVVLRRCAMDYARTTLLGAPGPGLIQDCLVRPGDRVKEGQVLGRLQDREARAEMELRRAQAENDVEIRLAEAKHARTLIRLKASESLNKRNILSFDMLSMDRLDSTAAALEVENAKQKRRVAQLQHEQAKAALRAREIVATHDGVVVAVLKRAGESVVAGTPVFQVVDPDRIIVAGSLDVHDAFRVRAGQSVLVSPVVGGVELEIERARVAGRVTFVDTLIDPKTQTCKVLAEIDNRTGALRAGLSALMEVLPDGAGAQAEAGAGAVAR